MFNFFNTKKNILILTGPTASGKSSIAIEIGERYKNIEIINADSMQIYEEIPIVSAQPNKLDIQKVKHKMYGIIKGDVQLNVSMWLEIIKKEINDTLSKNKIPFIVGGTTMYIRLLIDGLSDVEDVKKETKEEAEKLFNLLGKLEFYKKLIELDPNCKGKIKETDKNRMIRAFCVIKETRRSIFEMQKESKKISILKDFEVKKLILMPERDFIYNSCNNRFIDMMKDGGIEEIESLIKLNYDRNLSIHKAIGVPEIIDYIEGRVKKEEMINFAQQHTRNYAKRQMTWFRNKFNDFEIIDRSKFL